MKVSVARRLAVSSLVLVAAGLVGCASKAPAPVVERTPASTSAEASVAKPPLPPKEGYVVKKGDTLYSIALDHGLDYRELANWNGLDNPNRILIGQVLRTTPPGSEPAVAAPVAVAKPVGMAGAVEQRSLEGNSVSFKREPKVLKEAYSDEAFARAQQGAGAAVVRADLKPEKAEIRPEVKAETRPDPKPAENKGDQKPEAKPADGGDETQWAWPAGGKLIASFNESSNKGVDIAGKAGDPVLSAGDGKVVYSGTGLRGYGQLVIVKHNASYLSAYAHNSKILVKEGQSVARGQKIAEMGNTDSDQVKLHFEVRRQGKPVDPMKYLPAR